LASILSKKTFLWHFVMTIMPFRSLSMIAGLVVLALMSPSQAYAVLSPRSNNRPRKAAMTIRRIVPGGGDIITTTPELKPPPALYQGAVAAGAAKAAAPFGKILMLGIAAGCHIAFGAYLSISVGGNCPGLAESNPGLQKLIAGGMGLYVVPVFG
jgi:hypothetical protein